jgi:hypothetical protein
MKTATATRHEVEVDTKLAELHHQHSLASVKAGRAADSLHYSAGDRPIYRTRSIRTWGMTLDEVLAFTPNAAQPWKVQEHQRALDTYRTALATLKRLQAAIVEQDKLYTGWSRFFLVAQANGHIHSSMSCTTCYPTTQYGWLPTLSGLTEADAVAAQGPRLCTICFPSAPVEWTVGIQTEKTYCAGSGTYAKTNRRYAKCETCGKTVTVTQTTGNLRKHEAPR